MLRLLVLALLLLNGVYFAWSQGLLQRFGLAPTQQTEPQRLAQQIKPESLHLLTAQERRLVETPARAVPAVPAPTACWQAGPLDAAQSLLVRNALVAADLPAGAWSFEPVVANARWIVYMGKFANAEAMAKKRGELAALKLKFEPLRDPALTPGLSLGGFPTQAAAQAALEALARLGVRTARVLQERTEAPAVLLRVPAADETLRVKLDALKPALADKALSPCP